MYHINSIQIYVDNFSYHFSVHGRTFNGEILKDNLYDIVAMSSELWKEASRNTINHSFSRVVRAWKQLRCTT